MSMVRRLMVTMNTGGGWIPPNVMASQMAAASRWGAQYLQITAELRGDPFVLKSGFLSHLADAFPCTEQVLWIDGDVLIREDCDDIFSLVPIEHFGGVANFQGDTHNGVAPVTQARLQPGQITQLVETLRFAIANSTPEDAAPAIATVDEKHIQLLYELEQHYDPETFINGGLFVFSPTHHAGVFERLKGATDHLDELDPADEQAILNAAIILDSCPQTMLDRTYNRVGETAWVEGPMTDKVQHLAHFRWSHLDSRLFTPDYSGDKTDRLESIEWRLQEPPRRKLNAGEAGSVLTQMAGRIA